MSKISEILNQFIQIWVDKNELYSKQCTVKSVNVAQRTCVCSPTDGSADVLGVYIEADYDETDSQPSGFFVVPKVDSLVIVTFLDKDNAYISAWTEIESVVLKAGQFTFNDGANGGLIKIESLVSRLNDLEKLLSQLKTDFTAWVPANNDGGAALKTKLTAGFLTKTVPDSKKSDFENEKVKH